MRHATYQISLILGGNNEKRSLSNLGVINGEERGMDERGSRVVVVLGGELNSNL
jgi:hypothetical protein